MASTTFSVRLDPDMKEKMIELAQATGRSRNYLINEAVREYLERERWQIADIEQGLAELAAGDIATAEEVDATFARISTPAALEQARARVAHEQW
ncbi:MAG TPA: CopG family ribbon-helix-helix protein [Chloroflexota bacterium]|jgi:predicted transcriptional regulator|nr:CopG family ribbon-helix-helix protein [Chloroflexota bacterium]